MSQHKATISWKRNADSKFTERRYSREQTWEFDRGVVVPASASPSVIPPPYSNPANADPEEAFVAAISSCHMLTFLSLAAEEGFEIDSYDDEAVGVMTKNERDIPWVRRVAEVLSAPGARGCPMFRVLKRGDFRSSVGSR